MLEADEGDGAENDSAEETAEETETEMSKVVESMPAGERNSELGSRMLESGQSQTSLQDTIQTGTSLHGEVRSVEEERSLLCEEAAALLTSAPESKDQSQKGAASELGRGTTPSTSDNCSTLESPKTLGTPDSEKGFVTLGSLAFTRDIDVDRLSLIDVANKPGYNSHFPQTLQATSAQQQAQRSSSFLSVQSGSVFGTSYKVAPTATTSKTWRALALPQLLSLQGEGGAQAPSRKYPNTPLSMVWYQNDGETYIFVGLLSRPTLLKITPPKHHAPDKGGRFNVLPLDSQQVLLADGTSHQIRLLNHRTFACRHLAGCGKRGYLDGPLETCRMHSPCSMCLDPKSHFIYVADRGNHVIRKIDLMGGFISTIVGNGTRGSFDGPCIKRQALDSPFEVSFVEPHYLIISCSDNSIKSFSLKTQYLETTLVGS